MREENTVLMVCLPAVKQWPNCTWNFIRVRISEQSVCLTAACTPKAEGRVQQDPSSPRCDRTEASCPYRSLTDKSRNSKSTLALEASANSAAPIRACTLSEIAIGSSSLCPRHGT